MAGAPITGADRVAGLGRPFDGVTEPRGEGEEMGNGDKSAVRSFRASTGGTAVWVPGAGANDDEGFTESTEFDGIRALGKGA